MRWLSTGAGGPSVLRNLFTFSFLESATFCSHYVVHVISYSSSRLTLGSRKLGTWHRDRSIGRATSRMS